VGFLTRKGALRTLYNSTSGLREAMSIVESLKRHGISEEVINEALEEVAHK
jgi:hypothetical protein